MITITTVAQYEQAMREDGHPTPDLRTLYPHLTTAAALCYAGQYELGLLTREELAALTR